MTGCRRFPDAAAVTGIRIPKPAYDSVPGPGASAAGSG